MLVIIYFNILIGSDNRRVIIFGGTSYLPIDEFLYVLDTSTLEWYIPKVSGNIPSGRAYHTANVIGKYMVVAFGKYIISRMNRLLFFFLKIF